MKTFQKIILASAISAAPFASQAMEALDDSVLGNTTGQAGVTIDISIEGAGITVGEIEYTDTATMSTDPTPVSIADVDTTGDGSFDAKSGGSVILQDLNISGITKLTQTIDVLEGGDLYMTTTGVDGVTITLGDDATNAAVNDRSAIQLSGTSGTAELVNDLSIVMNLGASTTRIINMANAETLNTGAGVSGPAGDGWAALAIQANASFEITDLDVGIFGYTESDAARKTAGNIAAADGTAGSTWESYASADVNGDVTLNAGVGASIITTDGDTADEVVASRANGAAIGIENMKFYGTGGEGTNVTVDQVIWADAGGVSIQVGQIAGTLDIGAINIGGASIGSVKVSDINLAGLTQTIRGH